MSQPNKKPTIGVISKLDEDFEMFSAYANSIDPKLRLIHLSPISFQIDSALLQQMEVLIIGDAVKGIKTNDLVQVLKLNYSFLSIIVLTRKSDRKEAVAAMRAGANDYIFRRDLNREIFEKALNFCLESSVHSKEVKQRNVLIAALFDQSKDALLLCDSEFNIKDHNQEMERFFESNLSKTENLKQLVNKADYANMNEALNRVRENDDVEFTVIRNGDKSYYSMSLKEVHLPDLGLRRLYGIENITTRKLSEKQKVRTEKLQLTARMARIMAHEVRNPLTNISLSTDFLAELLEENDEAQTYIEIMERNTKRINTLIDDLLQSARPFELVVSEFELSDLVNRAIEQTKDRRELLNIALDYKPKDIGACYAGDLEKLVLVLVNLITNAFEALEKTENPILMIESFVEDNKLVFTLTDNGKGMDEETADRLFDAFYSARNGGLGLGMTTVKNIVDSHKGKILVKSKPDEGTQFRIMLPIKL
jgi:signal transduction histidine kinase/DNA-binding NarL/FixJ family response regulator